MFLLLLQGKKIFLLTIVFDVMHLNNKRLSVCVCVCVCVCANMCVCIAHSFGLMGIRLGMDTSLETWIDMREVRLRFNTSAICYAS